MRFDGQYLEDTLCYNCKKCSINGGECEGNFAMGDFNEPNCLIGYPVYQDECEDFEGETNE